MQGKKNERHRKTEKKKKDFFIFLFIFFFWPYQMYRGVQRLAARSPSQGVHGTKPKARKEESLVKDSIKLNFSLKGI